MVSESESEYYLQNGNEIVICPDKVQGNLCRVRNWILETYLDRYDAIVILDDDYKNVLRWNQQKTIKIDADSFEELC